MNQVWHELPVPPGPRVDLTQHPEPGFYAGDEAA